MSKYRRIRYEDRCQIYALSKRGASQESIASILGVSQSAVSREMRRNRGQRGYRFKQAEATAHARQAIRSKPRKLTAPIRREIEAKLRQMRWSPEQISGWLSEQGIAHQDIAHALKAKIFFATPYHTNGLIRDFFPKGTDFSTISSAEVAKVERLLNARPRKSPGFRSPQEVFHSLAYS